MDCNLCLLLLVELLLLLLLLVLLLVLLLLQESLVSLEFEASPKTLLLISLRKADYQVLVQMEQQVVVEATVASAPALGCPSCAWIPGEQMLETYIAKLKNYLKDLNLCSLKKWKQSLEM